MEVEENWFIVKIRLGGSLSYNFFQKNARGTLYLTLHPIHPMSAFFIVIIIDSKFLYFKFQNKIKIIVKLNLTLSQNADYLFPFALLIFSEK
jgi:hypothetical protein